MKESKENMLLFIIFCFFPFYIEFIDWLIPGDPAVSNANGDFTNIAVHIASGHTVFNVTATLLFLPFLYKLANFVTKITPDQGQKEEHHLVVLGDPKDLIPATAFAQAEAQIDKLKDIIDRMYLLVGDLLNQKTEQHPSDVLIKINDYEQITDNIQKEITVFLIKLSENSLTTEESQLAQSLMRVADELESIADYIDRLAKYTERSALSDVLSGEGKENFFKFYDEVKDFYDNIANNIKSTYSIDLTVVHRKSEELRLKAQAIRKVHLDRVAKGKLDPLSSLTYSDMVVAIRKIRSHAQNVAEAHV